VAKPATQRPKLPSVGRLGLVEPSAAADLDRLGWNTDAHVELLWSLSRAPDADDALRTIVRLADAVGRDWDELNQALSRTRAAGPAVRCARFLAGARRSSGRASRLMAPPGRRRHAAVGATNFVRPSPKWPKASNRQGHSGCVSPLRKLYRDRLLVLAALDLASTVENEPCWRSRRSASTCPIWPTPRWGRADGGHPLGLR
jgi:glutamate-ammonia-ligase adenylyltransferase